MTYLEISARQSGKTTRLINEIVKTVQFNRDIERCIVFVHSAHVINTYINSLKVFLDIKEIKNNTLYVNNKLIIIKPAHINNVIGIGFSDVDYVFFDEFDMFDIEFLNTIAQMPAIENSYYCTTPSRGRSLVNLLYLTDENDYLSYILNANSFRYTKHYSFMDLTKFYRSVPENVFLREGLGQFII